MKIAKPKYSLMYKFLTVVFVLLLVVPCTIKQSIKVELAIPITSTINKDRVASSACSVFSSSENTRIKLQEQKVTKNISQEFHGRGEILISDLFCTKTDRLENNSIGDKTLHYSTPLFIHFRELII